MSATYCCQHSLQKWCSHGTRISSGEGNMHTPHSSPSPPPPPPPSSVAAMRGWSRLSTPNSVGSCTPAASHASAGLAIQHSRSLSLDHPGGRGGKRGGRRGGGRRGGGRRGGGRRGGGRRGGGRRGGGRREKGGEEKGGGRRVEATTDGKT